MEALVDIRKLKTYFPILGGVFRRRVGQVKAVDGVDLAIGRGQWFGLVGESGCGKTTLGKTVLRLLQPTAGYILFDAPAEVRMGIEHLESSLENSQRLQELRREYDLALWSGGRLKAIRRRMQLVYQDPSTSLNPRMSVKDTVAEPLIVHGLFRGRKAKERVVELISRVGLTEEHLGRYPHEFSGGQRQRIAIARALATNPEFVVLDEPTSSLDVSVQAQILNLLEELRRDLKLTYLYITHDLSVAQCVCDWIAVMYLGKVVEVGPVSQIFQSPRHPYSYALITSVPIADPEKKRERKAQLLPGEVPSPVNPPSGCRFHPRCPRARPGCAQFEPQLGPKGGEHLFACWYPLGQ